MAENKKGKIIVNPKWEMTERRRVALARLSELNVSVRSHVNRADFLIEVPLRSWYGDYIEIGYLIAQLGDEDFPKDCEAFASDYPSGVLPVNMSRRPPVRFKESHSGYMQFVVTTAKERKA